MIDLKNTKPYPRHVRKPVSLMRGFLVACVYAAFMGFVVGSILTAIRTGYFLP